MYQLLVFSIALVVAGCSGRAGRGGAPTDTGDLSPSEFSRFALINQIQITSLRAVDFAIRSKSGRLNASELAKADNLGLNDAHCPVRQVSGAGVGAARDWSVRRLVTGAGDCPIHFREDWRFSSATQTLTFEQDLRVNGPDFARQTNVRGRHAQGAFVRTALFNRTTFVGTVTIEQAHLEDQDGLNAEIAVNHTFEGVRQKGVTTITVNRARRRVKGVIRFDDRDQTNAVDYLVNNRRITQPGFERLFSGYGISEIMAKLTNLR